MARRTRPGSCRSCGDTTSNDPDTFKPQRYCNACSYERLRELQKAMQPERKAAKVKPQVHLCDVCGTKAPRPGYRHDSCADIVEQGGEWPINY